MFRLVERKRECYGTGSNKTAFVHFGKLTDERYIRVSINKKAYKYLGEPRYVQMFVDEDNNIVRLLKCDKTDTCANIITKRNQQFVISDLTFANLHGRYYIIPQSSEEGRHIDIAIGVIHNYEKD